MESSEARCGDCELAEKVRARILTLAEQRDLAPLGWTAATPLGGMFRHGWEDDLRQPQPLPRQPVAHAYHIDGDRFFGEALCRACRNELKWARAGVDVYLESLDI